MVLRFIRSKAKDNEGTCLPSEPCGSGTYDIINSSLNNFVFKVQNRSIIDQREHRSGCFEVWMGRRIHCCNRDSVYWNHRKTCEEKPVNRVQDASRCALFRAPCSNAGGNLRVLTAEERVDNVDPDVPALHRWRYRASKTEDSVFTGAVHGTCGYGHPRR